MNEYRHDRNSSISSAHFSNGAVGGMDMQQDLMDGRMACPTICHLWAWELVWANLSSLLIQPSTTTRPWQASMHLNQCLLQQRLLLWIRSCPLSPAWELY